MAEIQLFTSRITPFGQRVQIALTEKKIPFDVIMVDVSSKPQALLEANPIHKKIPTIIHNGKPVAESLVILEYLEDAFPEQVPLLPKDAFEKSQARFWSDYMYKSFSTMANSLRTKPGTPENDECKEALETFFKTLESGIASFSPDGPFFTGDKFGYVDVIMAPLCNFLILFEQIAGIPVPGPDVLPRFHKWVATVRAYPSVSAILPSPEVGLAAIKARFMKPAGAAPTH